MKLMFHDTPISGGAFEEVYSTEETRIGTWIDGKPIYRKVLTATSPSVVGNFSSVAHVTEIDYIKSMDTVLLTNAPELIPVPYPLTNILIYYSKISSNFFMKVTEASFTNCPVTVVIEYTKTTD